MSSLFLSSSPHSMAVKASNSNRNIASHEHRRIQWASATSPANVNLPTNSSLLLLSLSSPNKGYSHIIAISDKTCVQKDTCAYVAAYSLIYNIASYCASSNSIQSFSIMILVVGPKEWKISRLGIPQSSINYSCVVHG